MTIKTGNRVAVVWLTMALPTLAADMTLSVPSVSLELSAAVEVAVSAHDVLARSFAFTAQCGAIDLAPSLNVQTGSFDPTDANDDQVLESLDATYKLQWAGAPIAVGDTVIVRVEARSTDGTLRDQGEVIVAANVAIDPSNAFPSQPGVELHVPVTQQGVVSMGESLRVRLNGVDITDQVTITGPVVVTQDITPSLPPILDYQYSYYDIALGDLVAPVGSELTLSLTVFTPNKTLIAEAALVTTAAVALTQAQLTALKAFVQALKLKRDNNSNVCVGANEAAIEAAADALRLAFPTTGVSDQRVDCPDFDAIVSIEAGASTATGNADVVIAIGKHGQGTGAGKDAKPTNTQIGGASVAVGGNGGSAGQSGGAGGDATAKSQGQNQGTSIALGGNGGDPTNNNNKAGVKGRSGKAEVVVGGPNTNLGGSPDAGSPGTHGTGGAAISAKGSKDGSHEGRPAHNQ